MRFYLTTPIYYVNSTPHIGHAYTTIAADIVVRHFRQRGAETFFLTGTDEHALKNVRAAEAQGLDVQSFVDRLVEEHWRLLPGRVGAAPDFFIRTTDEGHKRFVQDFLQQIYDNGDIYEGTYSGLYCVSCEAFYSEGEAVGGNCPEHGIPLEWIEERNWFFRLSAYQDRLLELYRDRPDVVLPNFRANEARRFIERGLQDISVSRAGQPWGIPVPWDPEHVVYVWVDALINYLSALTYARPGEDLRETFWPAVRHMLAKDILRFHCVIWPALLLSAGYEVPQQLFVHGYLLLDDRKISKSVGNVIDPLELVDLYGPDPIRFWCARAVSFGQDGSYSVDDVHERYERELANDLGNLLSRSTAMIARYREGRLRRASSAPPVSLDELGRDVAERIERFDITGAVEVIWASVRRLNQYVEEQAPWRLAKEEGSEQQLDDVLYHLADGLRGIAIALSSYLPETAPRILEALRQPPDLAWELVRNGAAGEVEGIEAAEPLFPRIDAPAAA